MRKTGSNVAHVSRRAIDFQKERLKLCEFWNIFLFWKFQENWLCISEKNVVFCWKKKETISCTIWTDIIKIVRKWSILVNFLKQKCIFLPDQIWKLRVCRAVTFWQEHRWLHFPSPSLFFICSNQLIRNARGIECEFRFGKHVPSLNKLLLTWWKEQKMESWVTWNGRSFKEWMKWHEFDKFQSISAVSLTSNEKQAFLCDSTLLFSKTHQILGL